MDINEILKDIGIFATGSISIAGIVIYFSKKIFENQISLLKEEHLQRFNKIYNEKLYILKEIYRRIVIAEKSIEFLMRPVKLGSSRTKDDIENETINNINSLFDYFEENEIILNEKTAALLNELKTNFYKAWGAHNKASFMEQARGTDAWSKSIENKIGIYNTIVIEEIPKIKNLLKDNFQKQLKVLEF